MLCLVGDGDQKNFTKTPRHFSMQNSWANTEKYSAKFFWRAGKVRIFLEFLPEGPSRTGGMAQKAVCGRRLMTCGSGCPSGGLHVLQTFMSMDVSEEVQIQGRTARQGKKGTYSLILKAEDLKEELLQAQSGGRGCQGDFQAKSGSPGSCLLFLHFLGL